MQLTQSRLLPGSDGGQHLGQAGTAWGSLHNSGAVAMGYAELSTSTSLNEAHRYVKVTSNVTLTLPSASTESGRSYLIEGATGGAALSIAPDGTDTINGGGSQSVSDGALFIFVSDRSSDWRAKQLV
jgi:hypothetical protein